MGDDNERMKQDVERLLEMFGMSERHAQELLCHAGNSLDVAVNLQLEGKFYFRHQESQCRYQRDGGGIKKKESNDLRFHGESSSVPRSGFTTEKIRENNESGACSSRHMDSKKFGTEEFLCDGQQSTFIQGNSSGFEEVEVINLVSTTEDDDDDDVRFQNPNESQLIDQDNGRHLNSNTIESERSQENIDSCPNYNLECTTYQNENISINRRSVVSDETCEQDPVQNPSHRANNVSRMGNNDFPQDQQAGLVSHQGLQMDRNCKLGHGSEPYVSKTFSVQNYQAALPSFADVMLKASIEKPFESIATETMRKSMPFQSLRNGSKLYSNSYEEVYREWNGHSNTMGQVIYFPIELGSIVFPVGCLDCQSVNNFEQSKKGLPSYFDCKYSIELSDDNIKFFLNETNYQRDGFEEILWEYEGRKYIDAQDFFLHFPNVSATEFGNIFHGKTLMPVQIDLFDTLRDQNRSSSQALEDSPLISIGKPSGGWTSEVAAAICFLHCHGFIDVQYRSTLSASRKMNSGYVSIKSAQIHAEIILKDDSREFFLPASNDLKKSDVIDKADKDKLDPFRKYFTQAMMILFRAIISYGDGLFIGPDCDGILNYNDVPSEECKSAIDAAESKNRKEFSIDALLESVVPPSDRLDRDTHRKPLKAAKVPAGLLTSPKHYQLQGLQFMLDRERKGDALNRGHALLHPAWIQLVTKSGCFLYVHQAEPCFLSFDFCFSPPVGTCGGFIADEMGLGKSLEILMLANENRPPQGWAVENLENLRLSQEEPIPIKTTLIVAPSTLLEQWQKEITTHFQQHILTWGYVLSQKEALEFEFEAKEGLESNSNDDNEEHNLRRSKRKRRWKSYNQINQSGCSSSETNRNLILECGPEKPKSWMGNDQNPRTITPVFCRTNDQKVVELHTVDIALCSYELLRNQIREQTAAKVAPLLQWGFWRVCLDEAQLIANNNSVAAIMASNLWRRHAWVITGTPITSKIDEVRGLLEFLAFDPFYRNKFWNRQLKKEYESFSPVGLLSMRSLLRGVMLRRSKKDVFSQLGLPECNQTDAYVKLSSVEYAVYRRAKQAFLASVKNLQRHRDIFARAMLDSDGARQGAGLSSNARSTEFLESNEIIPPSESRLESMQRRRVLSLSSAKAMKALTALRQSTCHPQISKAFETTESNLGCLSMLDIMKRLVLENYTEWESCLRKIFEAKLIVQLLETKKKILLAKKGSQSPKEHSISDIENIVNSSIQEIRLQARASAIIDIVGVLERVRSMDGAINIKRLEQLEEEQKKQWEEEEMALNKLIEEWDNEFKDRAIHEQSKLVIQKKKKLDRGANSNDKSNNTPEVTFDKRKCSDLHLSQDKAHSASEKEVSESVIPTEEAKSIARAEMRGKPELSEAVKRKRKEAHARWRHWKRVELGCYELLMYFLTDCLGLNFPEFEGNIDVSEQYQPLKRQRKVATQSINEETGAKSNCVSSESMQHYSNIYNRAKSAKKNLQIELGLITDSHPGVWIENDVASSSSQFHAIRRSRRQAGIDASSLEEVRIDPKLAKEQIENSVVILKAFKEILSKRNPLKSAEMSLEASKREASGPWANLQFSLKTLLEEMKKLTLESRCDTVDVNPLGIAKQDDRSSCPICFDTLSGAGQTVTRCGHHFCCHCIREVLSKSKSRAICPICRTPISENDLFDAATEEGSWDTNKPQDAVVDGMTDYGAKLSMLLAELSRLRSLEPTAKVVVFSSWGRLLKLASDCVAASGFSFASLYGGSSQIREKNLKKFVEDPNCTILFVMMSNSSGAAGLTLNVASVGFILEPTVNPGLEKQAAARIYRLGQTKSCRILRLVAKDTIDEIVIQQQKNKMDGGETELLGDSIDNGVLVELAKGLIN